MTNGIVVIVKCITISDNMYSSKYCCPFASWRCTPARSSDDPDLLLYRCASLLANRYSCASHRSRHSVLYASTMSIRTVAMAAAATALAELHKCSKQNAASDRI